MTSSIHDEWQPADRRYLSESVRQINRSPRATTTGGTPTLRRLASQGAAESRLTLLTYSVECWRWSGYRHRSLSRSISRHHEALYVGAWVGTSIYIADTRRHHSSAPFVSRDSRACSDTYEDVGASQGGQMDFAAWRCYSHFPRPHSGPGTDSLTG